MCRGWRRHHTLTADQLLLPPSFHRRLQLLRGGIRSWGRGISRYEFVADHADAKNGRHDDGDEYGRSDLWKVSSRWDDGHRGVGERSLKLSEVNPANRALVERKAAIG